MKHSSPLPGGGFFVLGGGTVELKVARQVRSEVSVTLPPAQPPPVQPANCEVLPAVAVSVTGVPTGNCVRHSVDCVPQSMPSGADFMLPKPVPPIAMVSVFIPPTGVSVAPAGLTTYAVVPWGLIATASGLVPTLGTVSSTAPLLAARMLSEPLSRFTT